LKCDPLKSYSDSEESVAENSASKLTIRVIIWPKKPAFEIEKNDYLQGFAICELAGHFVICDEKVFNEITEEIILELTNQIKLSLGTLLEIKRDLTNMFSS